MLIFIHKRLLLFGKLFRRKAASDQIHAQPDRERLWRAGMQRTNQVLGSSLRSLLLGRKGLDEEARDELEMTLLSADVGIETTLAILERLEQRVKTTGADAFDELAELLYEMLEPVAKPLEIPRGSGTSVIMVVGVNGVGKTTSIGKMAYYFQQDGYSVVLAAGDTFRAAAIDQLQVWGERIQVPVIAQKPGSDSASVIYDGLQSAQRREANILIADTAGRLHNKSHLMDELGKVVRVMKKLDANAPTETLLVVDASTGQNALNQAREFNRATPLTGLVVTKLDGTARGGILLSLAEQMGLPVRFIGLGEGIEDLQPFDAAAFVAAILESPEQ